MLSINQSNLSASQANLSKAAQAIELLYADSSVGFLKAVDSPFWDHCLSVAGQWGQNLDQFVLIGIGGSSLGPQWLSSLCTSPEKLFVLDNPDPLLYQRFEKWVTDWSSLGVIIASKSGGTLETLCLSNLVLSNLQEKGRLFKNQVAVITETQNQDLYNWAKQEDCVILEIPLSVGGRYSVLSPVGILPAALLGLDIQKIKAGAAWALGQKKLLQDLVALSLQSFEQNLKVTYFWGYSSYLRFYGLWMQQLWAESLGKPTSTASVPVGLVGANDQHSVLQQLMQGESAFWGVFIKVKSLALSGKGQINTSFFKSQEWTQGLTLGQILNAEADATFQALSQSGRLVTQLEVTDLTEESIGALLMLSQLWVASLGVAIEINPFDQPGVELGKRLVRQQLSSR